MGLLKFAGGGAFGQLLLVIKLAGFGTTNTNITCDSVGGFVGGCGRSYNALTVRRKDTCGLIVSLAYRGLARCVLFLPQARRMRVLSLFWLGSVNDSNAFEPFRLDITGKSTQSI